MAEALGVAAAAVQIADTAVKLRTLWSGLKNMPTSVHNMVEEIHLLADTLSQIQDVPLPDTALQQNITAWQDCRSALQAVSASFKNLVTDLEEHINKHVKSGSIRAFWRRDELNEYRDRLERLKTTMILARQAYSHALLTQQNSTIIDMLRLIRSEPQAESTATTSIVGASSQTPVSDVRTVTSLSLNNDLSAPPQRMHARFRPKSRSFEVKFLDWVFHKSFQILVDRSHGAWTLNLRIYNHVPRYSDAMIAARAGDWIEVAKLFNERKASPFDYCYPRMTLLHVAADQADVYGCHFLLRHGLSPDSQVDGGPSPLEWLGRTFLVDHDQSWDERRSAHVMEVVRSLASSVEHHVDREYGFSFNQFPAPIVNLLVQSMAIDYDMIEPLRRASAAVTYEGGYADSLRLILGTDLSLRDAFILLRDKSPTDRRDRNHRDILRNLALRFTHVLSMDNGDAVQQLVTEWRPVAIEIIAFEREIEQPIIFRSLLMQFLLYSLILEKLDIKPHEHGTTLSQKLTSTVRSWLNFLVALGVNLESYATAERYFFLSTPSHHISKYIAWLSYFRLMGLTCGPNVEDWFVYAVVGESGFDAEYEMAGDFWQWTENPELFLIPGTFLNGHDDSATEPLWRSAEPCLTAGPIF